MNGRELQAQDRRRHPGVRGASATARRRSGRYLVDRDVETPRPVAVIGQRPRARTSSGSEEVAGSGGADPRRALPDRRRAAGPRQSNQVNDPEMRRDNQKVYIPITTLAEVLRSAATRCTPTPSRWGIWSGSRTERSEVDGAASPRPPRDLATSRSRTSARRCVRIRKEVDQLVANWTDGAGLDRRHLAAGGRDRHLLGDADLDLGARLRDRPAQGHRRHRRRDLRPVPDRVGVALAGGRALGQRRWATASRCWPARPSRMA